MVGEAGSKDAGIRDSDKSAALGDTAKVTLGPGKRVVDEFWASEERCLAESRGGPAALAEPASSHFLASLQAERQACNQIANPPTHTHHHALTALATMGVPFEALLPYGIMIGVRQCPP